MPFLSTSFTPEDYALWNMTCLFTLSKKIVGSDSSSKVQVKFIKVIGPGRVSGVQILPGYQFRVELKTVRDRQSLELQGLDFRGVHLTPQPAYEVFHQVFVDQVPFQVPNEAFKIDLGLYGRVVAVKHLPVKGFPQIVWHQNGDHDAEDASSSLHQGCWLLLHRRLQGATRHL